ncbi:neutral/alkaline non-lysosomal ceramidase N-terminal domain-containing protein [Planctomycetota bacterium]
MKHKFLLLVIAGLSISVFCSCATAQERPTKASLEIGFAKVKITPPMNMPLFGQLFAYFAKGIESDLYAKAMCISDGDTSVMLVSCDVCVIPTDMVKNACRRAEQVTGVPASNIIICATHTHSGPVTELDNALSKVPGNELISNYCETLESGIVRALEQAYDNATKGKLTLAYGELPGYGFNRRFVMSDGTIQTHPLTLDPHIVKPEGPDSKDIFAFCAYDEAGRPTGAAVNFTCHATVMKRNNEYVSADYPGKVSEFVAEKLDPEAISLFLQGTSGNICQVNPLDGSRKEVGLEWSKRMGRAIGGKAIQLIEEKSIETAGPLRVVAQAVELPRRKTPSSLAAWALNYEDVPAEKPGQTDYGTVLYNEIEFPLLSLEDIFDTPYWANTYANTVRTQLKNTASKSEFNIKVIAQDNWALVALPGEFFIEFGNAIKAQSPFKNTIVVCYANGSNWYFPTKKAFSRPGGYETNIGTALFAPEAGDIVIQAVTRMLQQAHNL